MPPAVVHDVLATHIQEAASLCETRVALLRLPHLNLTGLRRLDDRLVAHLDGVLTAGEEAPRHLDAELETPSRGGAFTVAICALREGQTATLDRLWSLATAAPAVTDGLVLALGWAARPYLQ